MQQSTSNNNNKAIDQELLARQRLFAQYRNMDFNNSNIPASSASLISNNKIQPPINKLNNHSMTNLDGNFAQQQADFFNSLSGQAALLNSQFMAPVNPNALPANILQKHPQSKNTPNSNSTPSQQTQNSGSVVNGTPMKRDP